jgi:hypothetical protein
MLGAGAKALAIVWAEALGLGAWILLWGGFGQAEWSLRGIKRLPLLMLGAVIWLMGWMSVRVGPSGVGVNLGWAALTLVAAGLAMGRDGYKIWMAWIVLGTIASLMRGLAPIQPPQASVVPWLAPEAVCLGLLAAGAGGTPLRGALAAAGASAISSLWWMGAMGLTAADWLFTVTAVLAAWMVGAVIRPVVSKGWI